MFASSRVRPVLRGALSLLMGAGVVSAASFAEAASACLDETCSTGTAALRYESRERIDTTLTTKELRADFPFNINVGVRALMTIDPVKDSPIYVIDMPRGALVDATWPERQFITLKLSSSGSNDGMLNVRHTLSPTVEVRAWQGNNEAGATKVVLNAQQLLDKIPGGSFNYDSAGQVQFMPWGFQMAAAQVNAPDINRTTLAELAEWNRDLLGKEFEGAVTLNAIARPVFSYKTTAVALNGQAPITADGGTIKIPTVDANAIDVNASVQGEVSVTGTMAMKAVVRLGKVFGLNLNNAQVPLGLTEEEFNGITSKVNFPNRTIHIPLPNVKVPTTTIDLGAVKAGSETETVVEIANTGELGARLNFESSDGQFAVPTGLIKTGPGTRYGLRVAFRPKNSGEASAKITVKSNDPDSPTQEFVIRANGSSDGAGNDEGVGPGSDSGCGCRTTKTAGISDWSGYGLLAFGMLFWHRRRKNKA